MKCRLCQREEAANESWCPYHLAARENLRSAFERWRHAYGDLKWEAFLYRVLSLSETGLWVKEVAEFELNLLSKEGSRWE